MSFNLKGANARLSEGANARLSEGASALSEFSNEVGVPEPGAMADGIILSIAVLAASEYERQSGGYPSDEKEFVELMVQTLFKLSRSKSSLARVARKVLQNPNVYSRKLKGSL